MSEEKPPEKPRLLVEQLKERYFAAYPPQMPVDHSVDTAAYWESLLSKINTPMPVIKVPLEPKLADAKTHELIMELLSRGFAVIKTPESGVPDILSKD